jgi:omega-6 fatty acid desaturase (delta-12 desaturase)
MSKIEDPISLSGSISFHHVVLRKAIPANLFKKDELRFLVSVGYSVGFTLLLMYLGKNYIPLNWWMLPVWVAFAVITGTVWTGVCRISPLRRRGARP